MCILSHSIVRNLRQMLARNRVCRPIASALCAWLPDFQALFDSIKLLSVDDSGHTVMPKVSASLSWKGEWKGAELNTDISWSVSFGWRYIWFKLPMAGSLEPVAKHLSQSSAFDGLLANVARHNELCGKPNYFFQKNSFRLTNPNFFRHSRGNKIFLVWPNLTFCIDLM